MTARADNARVREARRDAETRQMVPVVVTIASLDRNLVADALLVAIGEIEADVRSRRPGGAARAQARADRLRAYERKIRI